MTDWLKELDRLDREPGGAIPFFTLLRNHARELIDAAKKVKECDDYYTSWAESMDSLTADRDNLKALLRRVEWMGSDGGATKCPVCGGYGHGWDVLPGHAPDCELKKLLRTNGREG